MDVTSGKPVVIFPSRVLANACTSAYTVDPHQRTAEDVTDALFREEILEEPMTTRPEPKNKNTTAHLPLSEDNGDGTTVEITAITVGVSWLAEQVAARRKPGQKLPILQNGLRGEKKKELDRICGYLEQNTDRMRYDVYLAEGYPIASGVIEGAYCHLVKDRMERSGMRWQLKDAQSMLHVRTLHQSDHLRCFLDDRIKTEVAAFHPNRSLLTNYETMVLAC
ncbi:hypothetical protein SH449x_003245 [Pirellulaceae bacterium SH449]